MLGRAFLWASENPRVEDIITNHALARPIVERFVAGERVDDALEAIDDLNSRGIGGILDLLGEGVDDPAGAQSAADDYLTAIKRVQETGVDTRVSVKLTQLGLAFDKHACIDHLRRLATEAQAAGTSVEIDMEQLQYVSDTLDIYRVLQGDFPELRVAIQAYLRRTPVDLAKMAPIRPRIRLVKGTYAEDQSVALQRRREIDAQYAFLTDWLFENGTDPGIATHDHKLIDHAQRAAERTRTATDSWEIQMLYGIRRELQDELARRGHRVRVYVPFGTAWYPYLMRRIAERPANVRFFLRALARG